MLLDFSTSAGLPGGLFEAYFAQTLTYRAIPSNLIMQRLPPAYYLAGNIFMWGALLMAQAGSQSFSAIAALRVLSGAFEAIADPAFMLITSMFYTRSEQPSRISAWYLWNGFGVAGGGLIGYGIGNISGALASWRYEFLIVGACCCLWSVMLLFFLPNSPATVWGFTHEERLLMIARMRKNQTGIEHRHISWEQVKETYTDYKTVSGGESASSTLTNQYMFLTLGFVANIPNGGISNVSTLRVVDLELMISSRHSSSRVLVLTLSTPPFLGSRRVSSWSSGSALEPC